ncbi:MAG: integration host factor subunit beta [Nitrospiraceae bacterium]|jgi:integration host factor subunit beta|nr:MAG: integration host factor subunit beta [Nitrospiraceae bacterium]
MTKSVLIEKVAEKVEGLTRNQTEIVVETVFESIKKALMSGEKIEIRGFGNFRLKTRNPRKARNPKTGETVEVPGKKVLYFKVGKALKEALNQQ